MKEKIVSNNYAIHMHNLIKLYAVEISAKISAIKSNKNVIL